MTEEQFECKRHDERIKLKILEPLGSDLWWPQKYLDPSLTLKMCEYQCIAKYHKKWQLERNGAQEQLVF